MRSPAQIRADAQRIKELDGKATAGPWTHDEQNTISGQAGRVAEVGFLLHAVQRGNLDFIAESRTLAPSLAQDALGLLDEVERLRALSEKARCVWCGFIGQKDDVAAHVVACLKHPISVASDPEQHGIAIVELRAENERLHARLAECEPVVEAVREFQGSGSLPAAAYDDETLARYDNTIACLRAVILPAKEPS